MMKDVKNLYSSPDFENAMQGPAARRKEKSLYINLGGKL
jgi:hypothetical protein